MAKKLIADILNSLQQLAPQETAEPWDNVGLLLGDARQFTESVVVSIDLTQESLQLALRHKASLILTHHPCIFPKDRGLSRVVAGSVLYDALRAGVAVATYHTNFDQCALEVVQAISEGLGLQPKGRLLEGGKAHLMKLVTFVPESHVDQLRDALCAVGAGQIGNYDSCTFGAEGTGTFRALEGARPFLGHVGSVEKVQEIRLETIFPTGMQQEVMAALKKAHPYEEVAFDIIELGQQPGPVGLVKGLGYGFWGEFPSPKPFSEIAKDVKSLFNIHGFWITNPVPSSVTRVGFVAGKGASFIGAASQCQCDLFITGEAGYHAALNGVRRGTAVMELGHRESERFFLQTIQGWLKKLSLETVVSEQPTQMIFV